MANGKPKTPRRRRQTAQPEVVYLPFRVDELKGMVMEKIGNPRNKGGRPRKV